MHHLIQASVSVYASLCIQTKYLRIYILSINPLSSKLKAYLDSHLLINTVINLYQGIRDGEWYGGCKVQNGRLRLF